MSYIAIFLFSYAISLLIVGSIIDAKVADSIEHSPRFHGPRATESYIEEVLQTGKFAKLWGSAVVGTLLGAALCAVVWIFE